MSRAVSLHSFWSIACKRSEAARANTPVSCVARPVAFLNQNGAQVPSVKSQDGKPIEDVELSRDVLPTWEAMEEMVKKGKVRNLGISNFNIRRTEDILRRANVKPLVNQVEVNWGVPNDELLQYSRAHDVMLEAYSPLGSNTNIAQYLEEPVVQDVAKRNKLTPAQVLLAWPLARGIITLPKSVTPSRIEENFKVMDVELPQEDVELLLNEAQKHPINRTVNPVEAWGVKDDIYEDGIDQRRLGDLKGAAYTPAAASQSPREHRLEPNNRSFSTQTAAQARARAAGMMSSSSFSERATVLQNKMAGKRAFSTSQASSATAEAQPSSQEEAPIVRASPILRTSAKDAIRTPGLAWKDGEEGVERETRKMNMYTVGTAKSHPFPAADRTYPARKAFLYDVYARLLSESQLVIVLQHNNLTVIELKQIRKDLAAVPLPEESASPAGSGDSGSGSARRAKAKFTVVRSGLMRSICRAHGTSAVNGLEAAFTGPVAVLSCPNLSPTYLAALLNVVDRALGHRPAAAPAIGKPHPLSAAANPRLVPLAALLEGNRLVQIPAARDAGRLPGLETLRAQIAGLLSAPGQQLAAVLQQASGGKLYAALEGHRRTLEGQSQSQQGADSAQ